MKKHIIKKLEELEKCRDCYMKDFDFGCEDTDINLHEWFACEDIVDFWLMDRYANEHHNAPCLYSLANSGQRQFVTRDTFKRLLFEAVNYFKSGKTRNFDGVLSMEKRTNPNRRRIAKKLKCMISFKLYNILYNITKRPTF